MSESRYRGRRSASVENEHLRVTVLCEGGHIAEILDKETGINPLWTPPWDSIEPSTFDATANEYGPGSDGKLLAGIMGHNLCLDIFGGPSDEEAAAGITAHGEGSVAPYEVEAAGASLQLRACFPLAKLRFERTLELRGRTIHIRETVENLTPMDRPIAWTQHVSLGPPFLEKGSTQFRVTATRSKVFEAAFGTADYLRAGAEFDWPMAPGIHGGFVDLSVLNEVPSSSAFTTHLMDPAREDAFFAAFTPKYGLAVGYAWKRQDFPWLGIWEENHSRAQLPWANRTLARGMEFGVSPIPETRRQMVDRGSLFGTPTYRWVPARGRISVSYLASVWRSVTLPGFWPHP